MHVYSISVFDTIYAHESDKTRSDGNRLGYFCVRYVFLFIASTRSNLAHPKKSLKRFILLADQRDASVRSCLVGDL